MNKVYLSLGIIAAMAVSAAIGWMVRPEPLPITLPPEVVKVEVVKEIPSPPETKVVERVVFQTKTVPVDREVVRTVYEKVEAGLPTDGRILLEGNKYLAEEGAGWKGFGTCQVFLDGDWRDLFKAPLDVETSKAVTIYAPVPSPMLRHRVTVGWSGQDSYLLGYQRLSNLHSRYTLMDVALPDGAGLTVTKSPSGVDVYATLSWEW